MTFCKLARPRYIPYPTSHPCYSNQGDPGTEDQNRREVLWKEINQQSTNTGHEKEHTKPADLRFPTYMALVGISVSYPLRILILCTMLPPDKIENEVFVKEVTYFILSMLLVCNKLLFPVFLLVFETWVKDSKSYPS